MDATQRNANIKNTKLKIVAIVVIYNKQVCESITCQNIQSIANDVEIIAVDNSTIRTSNKQYCKNNGIKYLSMNGNKGLSKAYNAAINLCMDSDIIILFDDDTEVTIDYFECLLKNANLYLDIDIFAPYIKGQDGIIYSPNEFNFLKNHLIHSKGQFIPQDTFNAISSCLAIRTKVFDKYRFNEALFVDQVDQFFFYEQRKLGRTFGVLDIEIVQNFYQRGSTLTPETGWKRLHLRIIDVFRHAKLMGNRKYILLAFIKCCGLGIQIGKKSRSLLVLIKAIGLSLKLLLVKKG